MGPDIMLQAELARMSGAKQKAFNWDLAAAIINKCYKDHPDLVAEAGLQGDWSYTGGVIFADGHAIVYEYTYLSSNWATPTLILSWDGREQKELDCFCEENERFTSGSKWDEMSLKILECPVGQLPE